MRNEVKRDLEDSAYDFQRLVWPVIRPFIGFGELKTVESTVNESIHDLLAGIDAWQVFNHSGVIRGIASRVQWMDELPSVKRTFTIRLARANQRATEYEKRCHAINHMDKGYLFPHLSIQGYATLPRGQGRLLAAAATTTVDLYRYAQKYPQRKPKVNPVDGVLFTAWRWKELELAGKEVMVVDAEEMAA